MDDPKCFADWCTGQNGANRFPTLVVKYKSDSCNITTVCVCVLFHVAILRQVLPGESIFELSEFCFHILKLTVTRVKDIFFPTNPPLVYLMFFFFQPTKEFLFPNWPLPDNMAFEQVSRLTSPFYFHLAKSLKSNDWHCEDLCTNRHRQAQTTDGGVFLTLLIEISLNYPRAPLIVLTTLHPWHLCLSYIKKLRRGWTTN